MNFPESMLKAAPSAAELAAAGWSSEQAEEFLRCYLCVKRTAPIEALRTSPDPLFRLMSEWDLGNVTIGDIRLASEPVFDPLGNWIVGQVEANLLTRHSSGEILELEYGTDHTLAAVALNSENLLQALPVAAQFLGNRSIDKINFEDCEAARAAARNCAEVAGGERYYRFFSVLFGGCD